MVINANLESINVFSLSLSAASEACSLVSETWDPSGDVNLASVWLDGFCQLAERVG